MTVCRKYQNIVRACYPIHHPIPVNSVYLAKLYSISAYHAGQIQESAHFAKDVAIPFVVPAKRFYPYSVETVTRIFRQ